MSEDGSAARCMCSKSVSAQAENLNPRQHSTSIFSVRVIFSVTQRGAQQRGAQANASKRRQTRTNASKRRGENASKRKQTRANVDKRKQTLTPPFMAVFYTPLCNPQRFVLLCDPNISGKETLFQGLTHKNIPSASL